MGRRRHVGNDLDGTSPRCSRGLLSSESVSSFPTTMAGQYLGLRAKLEHVDVTEEEVNRQLVRLQQQS